MLHVKHTEVPLYNQYISFVVTTSWKDFGKKFKAPYSDKDDPVYATCIDGNRWIKKFSYRCIFLVFNPWYTNHARINGLSPGVVAHEAIHAKNIITSIYGVQPCCINDEPEAYLVQWITDEAWTFVQKIKSQYQS